MEGKGADKGPPSTFGLVVSLLTHLLLLLPVIYIVELAAENLELFAWHPICMALGAGLLIMEGVFAVSGESSANRRLSRASRVRLHWILNLLGLALLAAGLAVILVSKSIHERPHFASTHSVLGLASLVLAGLVGGFGVLANNARWLYPRLRPVLLKVVHAYAAMATTLLLLASLVLGTYSHWWDRVGGSPTARGLILAAYVLAALIVLFKPVIGAVARTRVLMRPRPAQQQQQQPLPTNSS